MILFGEAPATVDLTTVLLQLAFYALFGVSVWPGAFVPAVAYFFIAEAAAAARLAVDSRRRFGLARIRLGLAAVATGLFGGAILIAGVAAAAAGGGTSSPVAQEASRFAGLVA